MRILACNCVVCWPRQETCMSKAHPCAAVHLSVVALNCVMLCQKQIILNLHGLSVCSRKDVISNASFLHDGAYRADWKAVMSAEGSCGLQHKAEVLRLEEEPSRIVLSLKPMCCETAAELFRTFLPSSWPWKLIPAPPPELCQLLPCGCAACCVF